MPRLLRVVMPRLLYDPPDLHLYAQRTQDKAGCRQVRVQVQGGRPFRQTILDPTLVGTAVQRRLRGNSRELTRFFWAVDP